MHMLMLMWVCLVLTLAGCTPGPWLTRDDPPVSPEARQQALQYFIQAKTYESQGNHLGAIVALRNAADLDPTSPTLYERLAANYLETGDVRMSILFARRGLELDPGRVPLRRQLVGMLENSGDRAGAAMELEELLCYQPADWRAYRRLAYLYIEIGQPDRVKAVFDRLVRYGNPSPQIRADLAGVLVQTGHYDRAEEYYRDIIDEFPSVEDAWLGLAELKLRRGQRNEALGLYQRALAKVPDSIVLPHYLARLITSRHDLPMFIYQEAPEFLYRLGVALADAGKYEEATVVFESIVTMRPESVEKWLDLARHYMYVEDYEQAEAVLGRALAAMPDSTTLYLFWGTLLEHEERFDDAIAVYQRGIKQDTDQAELYLYWALALEQQDEWMSAMEVYEQALEHVPGAARLHVRKGRILARYERVAEAIQQYEAALALDPRRADAHMHWGLALQQEERWEEAIARHERAVELDHTTTHALFYLGACLERAASSTGESKYFERATEVFRRLLSLDPDDAYALNYLGYMFADAGIHLDEAVELLQRAVALEPDNGAFLDSLGWAYYRLGEYGQAAAYLQQALDRLDNRYSPEEQAVIIDHAGDVARALGHYDEAREHWEAVLELTPDDSSVRRKLEELEQPAP